MFLSPAELKTQLSSDKKTIVVRADFMLEGSDTTALQEFEKEHIAGSRFLDITQISDPAFAAAYQQGSPYNLNCPAAGDICQEMGACGIGPDDGVVFYDNDPFHTGATWAYTLLKSAGHQNAAILSGGLRAWRMNFRDQIATGQAEIFKPVSYPDTNADRFPEIFIPPQQVWKSVQDGRPPQIIDVSLDAPSDQTLPVKHIPVKAFVRPDDEEPYEVQPEKVLTDLLDREGIAPGEPLWLTCGFGVLSTVARAALETLPAARRPEIFLLHGGNQTLQAAVNKSVNPENSQPEP